VAQSAVTTVPVDVVICCYNDGDLVPGLFESLQRQSIRPNSFRVIFVDNASTDGTRDIVARTAGPLRVEYVYEATLGHNAARNAGYARSTAPYIADLDTDVRVDPLWLENIARVIQERNPDLFGGQYRPFYLGPKPDWFHDRYYTSSRGSEASYLEDDEYLSGTTMIWRRQVVEDLGGFRSGLGLVGRGVARGDETNLIVRARREIPGFRVFYDPGIVVYALVRDECFAMQSCIQRWFISGRSVPRVWETTEKVSRLRSALVIAALSAMILLEAGKSFVWRNKAAYPDWRNHWYERILPLVSRLGLAWERLTRRSR
jgi:glycosyltransferase involved in cell wall biosynthesis